MIWCWSQRCSVDRKSTRLNSSHQIISYAVFCLDRKSTRLNSSHQIISYAVFCLKKKNTHLNSSHQSISDAVFCLKTKTQHVPIVTAALEPTAGGTYAAGRSLTKHHGSRAMRST